MLRTYNVKVNGKSYTVELEEVTQGQQAPVRETPAAKAPAQAAPVPAQAAPAPAKPAPAAPAPVTAPAPGAQVVTAPMPGTIVGVKVAPGDAVKKGTVLLVLEAMKMENEILAAGDGVIAAVHTSQGTSVNTGDPLVSFQ